MTERKKKKRREDCVVVVMKNKKRRLCGGGEQSRTRRLLGGEEEEERRLGRMGGRGLFIPDWRQCSDFEIITPTTPLVGYRARGTSPDGAL